MKWAHFTAMIWLQWCLLRNRIKRKSAASHVIGLVLLILGSVFILGAFFLAFGLGVALLPRAEPVHVMLAWVGMTCVFLFTWALGLVMALQRSDSMSFTKFLHLPAPLICVLLYNYIGSYLTLSMAAFLPAMLGLGLAMTIVYGPSLLMGLPLILSFVAMVTAITYQFRGWLEKLMQNKRRRQYVIAILTFFFVGLAQLPNLLNVASMRSDDDDEDQAALTADKETKIEAMEALLKRLSPDAQGETKESTEEIQERISELVQAVEQINKQQKPTKRNFEQISPWTLYIPPGWLSYGMRAAVERRFSAGALCALGMSLIALYSLRRSYKAALAMATGVTRKQSGTVAQAPRDQTSKAGKPKKPLLVEKKLPWVTEMESSVCTTSLQSLMRMPELKLLLLTPVILLGMGAFMMADKSEHLQDFAPLIVLAVTMLALLCTMQLIQNQFGLDRGGFCAYVLCPVPRHQILRAKNLAVAPVALGIGGIALIGLQFFVTMSLSSFLASFLQMISAYLILCLLCNLVSILGPMRLKDQGMKPNITANGILWQLGSMLFLPIAISPLMLPLGLEYLAKSADFPASNLIYLFLHAALLAGLCWIYLAITKRQGDMLQEQEQKILDTLTRR